MRVKNVTKAQINGRTGWATFIIPQKTMVLKTERTVPCTFIFIIPFQRVALMYENLPVNYFAYISCDDAYVLSPFLSLLIIITVVDFQIFVAQVFQKGVFPFCHGMR